MQPSWKKYADKMRSDNEQEADLAGEAFETERKQEMLTSQKARDWEEGRRQEWVKNKPEHVKKRIAQEKYNDPSLRTLEEMKKGGTFENDIIPSPGLVLVERDELVKETHNGIVLAKQDIPNTGVVVEIGDPLPLANGMLAQFPHKKGDRVIVRKFAPYIDITIKGHKCNLMEFQDVLGRFKNEE